SRGRDRARSRPDRRRRDLDADRGGQGRALAGHRCRRRLGRAGLTGVRSGMSEANAGGALDSVSRDLRAPRAAGVAGLAFAVLFVVSLLLLRSQPAAGSTSDEIAAWYLRTDS